MKEIRATLVQHIELLFGIIQAGFNVPADLPKTPGVQYVTCKGGTVPNVTVLSTLGLSRHELVSSGSGKSVRQELFVMFREGQENGITAGLLHQIAKDTLESNRAILRGDYVRRSGSLISGTNLVALYVTLPIYYPPEMWTCPTDEGEVVLCWMLPITEAEFRFLREQGWSKFEDRLNDAQFDLFDLHRPSLV